MLHSGNPFQGDWKGRAACAASSSPLPADNPGVGRKVGQRRGAAPLLAAHIQAGSIPFPTTQQANVCWVRRGVTSNSWLIRYYELERVLNICQCPLFPQQFDLCNGFQDFLYIFQSAAQEFPVLHRLLAVCKPYLVRWSILVPLYDMESSIQERK